jgi:hypothetical protein
MNAVRLLSRLSALSLLQAIACDVHVHDHDHATSGASCSASDAPSDTWQTFASTFAATYCTPCHAATLSGSERQGAPEGQDLDSLDAARAVGAAHLDAMAGAGPLGVHTAMPPSSFSPQPTLAERERFARWLACGLP